MSFFNEFPHTRTYDSDLAWLIKRMKEVLSRMDSVEDRMNALEDLIANFIENLHIDELIKTYILEMIKDGDLDILTGVEPFDASLITSNLIVPIDATDTTGKAARAKLLNGMVFHCGMFNMIYFEDYVTQFISPYSATDTFSVDISNRDIVKKFFGEVSGATDLQNKLLNLGYTYTYDSGVGSNVINIEGVFNDSATKTANSIQISSGSINIVYSLGAVRAQNSSNNVAAHLIIVPYFFK